MEGSFRLHLRLQHPKRRTRAFAQQYRSCAELVVRSKQEDAQCHGQQRDPHFNRLVSSSHLQA
jgi:hypothetical protein